MLAVPDKFAMLNQAMPLHQAHALLNAVPPDLAGTIRDLALSKEHATFALLSAHMIIFWLSQDSNVTPPVCLTAFTAAAIAKTPPMTTGLQSWKIAKGLYIVPLLFAYTSFLGGAWHEVFEIFFFALIGLYAISGAMQGYLENHLNWPLRLLTFFSAAVMLWPTSIFYHAGGAAIFAIIFFFNLRSAKVTENVDAQH